MTSMPQNSGKEFYGPGGSKNSYDSIQSQPALPGVAPPTGATTGAPLAPILMPSGPIDPNAPDILELIAGSTFKVPFTVTLKKRSGVQTFKSDAGVKTETAYKLCKETIRSPSDLLRIAAGMQADIYQPLNNMTLEFQLMLYLTHTGGLLNTPPKPAPVAVEAAVEATVEP